jgi:hypothetical protein
MAVGLIVRTVVVMAQLCDLDTLLELPEAARATMLETLLAGGMVEPAVVVALTVSRRSVRTGRTDQGLGSSSL